MKTIITAMIAAVSFVGIANAQTAARQVELHRELLMSNLNPAPNRNAIPGKTMPLLIEARMEAHAEALMWKAAELDTIAIMCMMAPDSQYGEADVLDDVAPYLTESMVRSSRAAYRDGMKNGVKPKCGPEAISYSQKREGQIERHLKRIQELHAELTGSAAQ